MISAPDEVLIGLKEQSNGEIGYIKFGSTSEGVDRGDA